MGATRFDTAAEGEAFLLERLQEKYGQEFLVVENGELEGSWYQRYIGTVAPAAAPQQSTVARVDSGGKLTDAWAVWQFPDLWAAADQACALVGGGTVSCDIYPNMAASSETWTTETPVSQFFEEAHPYVNVQVEFFDTDPETVAPQVMTMLQELDSGPYTYNLFVTQGKGNVIYNHKDSDPIPTLEELVLTLG